MTGHLLGIPALLFFGILVFFVFRAGRVYTLDALILICFGFYLGGSSLGMILNGIVMDLGALFGATK